MPHQIVSALVKLITPVVLLVILFALEYVAAKKIGHATAWRAMRPFFIFGFACLGVVTVPLVIRCAPYYLYGTVWSQEVSKKIGFFEIGAALALLAWVLVSGKKWMDYAKRVESESESLP